MVSLFGEKRIDDLFQIVTRNLDRSISQLDESLLLKNDSLILANETIKKFILKPLEIDFDNRQVNTIMVDLPWNNFPPGYDVERGKSYPCAKVLYTFKIISGDPEFLIARPKGASLSQIIHADADNNSFTIGFQTRYGNTNLSDEVKQDIKVNIKTAIDSMKNLVAVMTSEINEFNSSLEPLAQNLIDKKRLSIQKKDNQNQELNSF